jgi:hypothetical protein
LHPHAILPTGAGNPIWDQLQQAGGFSLPDRSRWLAHRLDVMMRLSVRRGNRLVLLKAEGAPALAEVRWALQRAGAAAATISGEVSSASPCPSAVEARMEALDSVSEQLFGDVPYGYRSLIVVDPGLDDKRTRTAALERFDRVAGRVELFGVDRGFGMVGQLRQVAAAGRVDGEYTPGEPPVEVLF